MKFTETLQSTEELYFSLWNAKALVYGTLKERIFEKEFFILLNSEITRVNKWGPHEWTVLFVF